jgi:hypothetical protein
MVRCNSSTSINARVPDRGPPRVVDRGEPTALAGLFQSGRPGQRAGLAKQHFQIVVQLEAGPALGDQPLMPGHLGLAIEDHQLTGVQQYPHPAADQPNRHRVADGPDGDLGFTIHAQPEDLARLEGLLG